MIAGIKIGLEDYKEKIPLTRAKFAEVYFRFDKSELYPDLFLTLKQKGLAAGLHYWGTVRNNFLYNLAHPNKEIRQETLAQIKQTIEIACCYKLKYVNVHPGNYRLVKINLNQHTFEDGGYAVDKKIGWEILLENIKILHRYALERNVLFLVETVPKYYSPVWYSLRSRLKPLDLADPDVKTLIDIANKGFFVANDLGHTLANEVSDNRSYLFKKLKERTVLLAKQTKLIHINTVNPPFNGTDTHNGILESDFQAGVLPTKSQLKEILSLFKNRNDVFLIPEPLEKHEENFLVLQEIIRSIKKN